MSIKRSVLVLLCTTGFVASAFAASNCTYSDAQSRNLTRTISVVNTTSNGVLSLVSKSPANANPTMAWDDSSSKSTVSSESSGTLNLGICCNDQNASPVAVKLVYNYTQGSQVSACTMNLSVKCSPTIELVQDSQSCENNAANIKAQYVDTVNTQYTVSSSTTTSTQKRS